MICKHLNRTWNSCETQFTTWTRTDPACKLFTLSLCMMKPHKQRLRGPHPKAQVFATFKLYCAPPTKQATPSCPLMTRKTLWLTFWCNKKLKKQRTKSKDLDYRYTMLFISQKRSLQHMKYGHWRDSPSIFSYFLSWLILFLLSSSSPVYLKLLETKGYIHANSQVYLDLTPGLNLLL